MTTVVRPNVARELGRLKDFQRDTVEHVFEKMYRRTPPARRFLVADEVGLGKTMVARGVVAKAVDHLWDSVGRIDIVYICSNGSIARQNIARLNVSEVKDASLPSRITLLPTVVRGLKHRKLNFISLTPQTSFDLRSSLGTYDERALLYWLLPEDWKPSELAAQNLLQGGAERERFRRCVAEYDRKNIDVDLQAGFRAQLARHPELHKRFADALQRFATWRKNLPEEDRARQRELVGTLRLELAVSCLGALEPDLVILDEFQRFKHLLDGSDQSSALAKELFNFGDARVLLLSATPYKMYTIAEEAENDDHFRDFLQTVAFLQADERRTASFKNHLDGYRNALFALGTGNPSLLESCTDAVQSELREVMVRTERLAASADRNGMLREIAPRVPLTNDEVATYLAYARIANKLQHGEVIEYWKSAPFLFNFMDEYQLKEAFKDAVAAQKTMPEVRDVLAACPRALLNWDDVERYRALDPANSRLRHLISDVIDAGAWKALWLPPSMPYYRGGHAFEASTPERLTKRLIFSSWQVVPKVVAAVLSYEAERRMFGERPDVERPNSQEERERLRPLLRFARTEGRLTGMPILGLLYPSIALAELGDPLEVLRSSGAAELPESHQVLTEVENRLRPLLRELSPDEASGPVDEAWYWAAPVLLDQIGHRAHAESWFRQPNLASVWRDAETSNGADDESAGSDAWSDHVAEFVRVATGASRLGRQPEDLCQVVARIAVAAPGVAALRALSRICGGPPTLTDRSIRNNAAWIAWSSRTLFNLPEVTAMIRRETPEESYWQSVLEYCVDGGLQAVLDEFLHVAQESEGVAHRPYREAARTVSRRAAAALQLRTATLGVDAITVENGGLRIDDRRMRARFAARFGAYQADEGAGAVRADDVRAAFNSPFWPFVLCSTSVGQEGLDFHLYCHAVVHWNLPSNPVDLEQREGRVHRFKGHAIRRNAALVFGREALASDSADPWQAVFDRASQSRTDGATDLVPYWILPAEGGARIERHVLVQPLSRDVERSEALRKTLTVYRMAFGQNRQDDIIAYLMARFPAEEIERLGETLRIDLAPPRRRYGSGVVAEPVERAAGEDVEDDVSSSGRLEARGVTLAAVTSLLDEYAASIAVAKSKGIDDYIDLLDRFASLKG